MLKRLPRKRKKSIKVHYSKRFGLKPADFIMSFQNKLIPTTNCTDCSLLLTPRAKQRLEASICS